MGNKGSRGSRGLRGSRGSRGRRERRGNIVRRGIRGSEEMGYRGSGK